MHRSLEIALGHAFQLLDRKVELGEGGALQPHEDLLAGSQPRLAILAPAACGCAVLELGDREGDADSHPRHGDSAEQGRDN